MAKFCSKCGTQLNDDATFCSSCGAPQNQGTEHSTTVIHVHHHAGDSVTDKFFNSNGRLNRLSYFLRVIIVFIFCLVVNIIPIAGQIISFVVGCWANYCLDTRRLHDLNRDNTIAIARLVFVLIGIPIAMIMGLTAFITAALASKGDSVQGVSLFFMFLSMAVFAWYFIWSLRFLFEQGTIGANDYGPDPLEGMHGSSATVNSDSTVQPSNVDSVSPRVSLKKDTVENTQAPPVNSQRSDIQQKFTEFVNEIGSRLDNIFESNEFLRENKKAVIAVAAIGVVLIASYGMMSSNNTNNNAFPKLIEKNASSNNPLKPISNQKPSDSNKSSTIVSGEYNQSLGGVKIGDTVEQMRKALGREDRTRPSDTVEHQHHEYRDVIITTDKNNQVVGMVSLTDKVRTERGIRQGDKLTKVLEEYGMRCSREANGDATLYEYPYDSMNDPDKAAVLRFSIKNGIVDYISLREVGTQEKKNIMANFKTIDPSDNSSTTSSATPTLSSNTSENAKNASKVLVDFHQNITNHNLRQAFNCLSSGFQSSMSYDGWANGFNTTVSSSVSNLNVTSETTERIVINYVLTAVDNPGGTLTFNGQVVMIREGGNWKIDEIVNKVR